MSPGKRFQSEQQTDPIQHAANPGEVKGRSCYCERAGREAGQRLLVIVWIVDGSTGKFHLDFKDLFGDSWKNTLQSVDALPT